MAIRYVCRGCRQLLAEFSEELNELQLGFACLTPEERAEMIRVDEEGNTTVKILCEYCQDAVTSNPELSLLPNPLQ